MTEAARLPQFVREALESEAGSAEAALPPIDATSLEATLDAMSRDAAEADVERSLLSLELALDASSASSTASSPVAGGPVAGGPAPGSPAPGSPAPGSPAPNRDGALPDGDYHRLFERLQGSVSRPPYRYAPFFARAAELFDLSEEAIMAEFARLDDPKVWTFAGLPGIHHAAVRGGPRVKSAETLFVRFKPGLHFPRHQHTGLERVLVLEGSYEDSHGVQHLPGQLREWPSGTEHSFKVHTSEPCIFASVVFGRRFYAWPLRALSKLLGK